MLDIFKAVTKGVKSRPVRAVIYGSKGCGKTTLASLFPDPIILSYEFGGSDFLDCARYECESSGVIAQVVAGIKETPYKTIIIDTADWLQSVIYKEICKAHGVDSIEDVAGGYGKGFTKAAEVMQDILLSLSEALDAGVHVVLLAHSAVKRMEEPGVMGSYDKHTMKLAKAVESVIGEWADYVLFLQTKTTLAAQKGSDKKVAVTSNERVIRTTGAASFDAKSRGGLPDSIDWKDKTVFPSELISAFKFKMAPVDAPVDEAPVDEAPVDEVAKASLNLAMKLKEADVNDDDINAFMVDQGYITEGQNWVNDSADDVIQRAEKNPEKFAQAVAAYKGRAQA